MDVPINAASTTVRGNLPYPEEIGITISRSDMHHTPSLSLLSLLLLLISAANLYLIGFAAWSWRSESSTPPKTIRDELRALGLILLSCSQLLYLVLVFVWWFRWMRFYPGNPIENIAILGGLLLSVAGLCTTPFGPASQRFITIVVAVTTAGMWLLAAVASVAV